MAEGGREGVSIGAVFTGLVVVEREPVGTEVPVTTLRFLIFGSSLTGAGGG